MNACDRVIRGSGEANGCEQAEEKRKHDGSSSPDKVEKGWGINVDLLDDMDKKLLKSLLNEGWRTEKRGLRRAQKNVSLDVEDKKRVRFPLNETNTRVGICRRVEERTGRETSRFDRSMRVLEWLDADCGTRLARHYEQAGGWRSLPQRQQRQQRACHQQPQQRQPVRLTGSSLVSGTDICQGYVKDSEDDSSSSEEDKVILEEEDELFNDEDADNDDLVLALRKWQEEQLLQQEHYEDLSMQEYVTSSEEDSNENDSDSEDELVLALKTWQEEQLRQAKLQQQLQHHRQIPLAQQPPALTPVIEDQVSSPSHDNFGYFYQDQNYLVYHYNKYRPANHQQQASVTPYWWGDISSVREGPSSPPVLVKHSEPGKSASVAQASNQGNRTTLLKAPGANGEGAILVSAVCDNNVKFGNASPAQGSLTPHQKLATTVATTTLPSSSAQTPRSSSHYSSLLLPPSSSYNSPASSPRLETQSWNFGNRVQIPISSESHSASVKLGVATDNLSVKLPDSARGCKPPGFDATKGNNLLFAPQTSQVNKTSPTSGSHTFPNWPSLASGDKLNTLFTGRIDKDATRSADNGLRGDAPQKTISSTLSAASSDSGFERSPVNTPPAQKPVGIDRIGYFFRKFQNKLSTSSGSSSSTSKITSSQNSGKKQAVQQNSQKNNGNSPRRLSLSISSIPSSSPLKAASPLAKVASVHARCSATRSDPLAIRPDILATRADSSATKLDSSTTRSEPLATNAVSKRLRKQWLGGHKARNTIGQDEFTVGVSSAPAGCVVSNVSLDSSFCAFSGDRSLRVSGGAGGGGLGVGADDWPAASGSLTPSARKGALNIDTRASSGPDDSRRGGTTPTFGTVSGKEVQPFFVPNSYQQSHQQQLNHQSQLQPSVPATKRSTGEINRTICRQYYHNGANTEGTNQSASRLCSQDSLDTLRISNEVFDNSGTDNDKSSAGNLLTGSAFLSCNGSSRGATQILNKSPGSETEHKIHSDSVERDPQGKIRTLFNSGGVTVSGNNSVNASGYTVNGSSNNDNGSCNVNFVNSVTGRLGDECSNVTVIVNIDSKRKEVKLKEEFVNSKSTERSSSTSSEERGNLTVPDYDKNRRGSHGSCNHLFREPVGGRKSPLLAKGRKSPSPVPSAHLKVVVSSTSASSSSSSAESSTKQPHQIVSRVLSLTSPSSPPSHTQQSVKSSPKFLHNHYGSECSTTKNIPTDAPPANFRSRRKFSDTGLTPVPRRLFSDGRRGSLTDEKTLVFAKSKLGKLRSEDRKLSDASSVAALVKQIHNLWGEAEEDADEENENSRETTSGFTCSFDDQVLFEKRRKKLPLSITREKELKKDGGSVGEDRKSLNKITSTFGGSIDNNWNRSEGVANSLTGDTKGRNNTVDKRPLFPGAFPNSSTPVPSVNPSSVTTGPVDSQTADKAVGESVKDNSANGIPVADGSSSGGGASSGGLNGSSVAGVSGSEFVAPLAQVASRQLVAAAVSSVAYFVGIDTPDNLITRGPAGISTGNTAGLNNSGGTYWKAGKKTASVQFQPIVSRDDNTVGDRVSPAVRSVLKQATRRHSSFAGFTDSNDDIAAVQPVCSDNLSSPRNKSAKNGLPKSKTSDNYKSILKPTEKLTLSDIDSATTTTTGTTTTAGDKKRTKLPSPKSKKGDKGFDYSPDPKNSELSLSLCLKATRSLSPRLKKYRTETKELPDSTDQSSQATPFSSTDREQFTDSGNCSLDLPTKTIGVQATPRTTGKTSNAGTQTSDLSAGGDSSTDQSSSPPEGSGWLQRLAAKCMASVGGTNRAGPVGAAGAGLPRAASVRAEWILGNKRMGSNPSSPVAPGADASEKFWVPHGVIARKRAQSLVPSLSKQDSEEDLSSEAATPASIPHPRDLAFNFVSEKAGTSGGSSDGQASTPPSGYNAGRRRASMHDAIDLTKIDTRLYDKKLVRQASVTSIEEESQGTIHVSLEHNSETGILTVNLIRAHNLLPRDLNYTANPYCRITILPGQRSSAQSRIHRKTLNPEFEEEFIFELPTEEVSTSSLEVSLYEYDQFSKDECVGYVRIPLNEVHLNKQVDLWRSITPYDKPKDQRDLGDVMFSLSYLPSAERLTVVIVRARNLRLLDDGKVDLNPFIKVCITSGNKKLKKKKTSTAHSTNSPIWNEALVFSVHRESLKNMGLEVSAYHDNKLGIDECIGRIRLPANSEDGIYCQELLKEKSMPARWYNLT
ncbi:hypothetical protein BsWGS_23866 [Bradybaena similaris]